MIENTAKVLVIHNEFEDQWLPPVIDHEVARHDDNHYAFAYFDAKDEICVFISTTEPQAVESNVRLIFGSAEFATQISDQNGTFDIEAPLELTGEVIWSNEFRPDDLNNLDPGMAIKLQPLSKSKKSQLFSHLKTFVFLDRATVHQSLPS